MALSPPHWPPHKIPAGKAAAAAAQNRYNRNYARCRRRVTSREYKRDDDDDVIHLSSYLLQSNLTIIKNKKIIKFQFFFNKIILKKVRLVDVFYP